MRDYPRLRPKQFLLRVRVLPPDLLSEPLWLPLWLEFFPGVRMRFTNGLLAC
jgi:hypothetical protein